MGRRARDLGVRAIIMNRVPRKGHIKKGTFEYDNKDMRREEVNTLQFLGEELSRQSKIKSKGPRTGAHMLGGVAGGSEVGERGKGVKSCGWVWNVNLQVIGGISVE